MGPSVRVAVPDDAATLARLLVDFNDEFDSPSPTLEDLTRRFAALLARDDQLALLFGEPAVGFAYLTLRASPYYDGPIALLEELYVRPDLRAGGIGTALLTGAVDAVRERDSEEMQINVDEVDVDTRRFYERHGFTNLEWGTQDRMLFYTRDLGSSG